MENRKDTMITKDMEAYRVEGMQEITAASYILRFTRNGLNFKPGQYLVVDLPEMEDGREYSVYSGIHDEFIEILVREVEQGLLSKKLKHLKRGDELMINGPFGFFMYNTIPPEFKKLLFIASGTGIAPFHSFVKSYPEADYHIIHGIRNIEETYGIEDYHRERYFTCSSGDNRGDYYGRLTGYLETAGIENDTMIYFCGNSNMITDSMEILRKRGYQQSQMFTEVYF